MAAKRPLRATDTPPWTDAAEAMYRAARAVAGPGGPGVMAALVDELARILPAATAFVAVFTDESQHTLRTLAAVLDGKAVRNFDYPLQGSPCAQVVGNAYRYVARGVASEFTPGTMFAAKGMDSYAAFPLNDSEGMPLGLLVAMDRQPIADAALAEALLKIFASRIVAEIERNRADDALRAAALAVSVAGDESVFAELVRYLAAILHVEMAFISRRQADDIGALHMLAVISDGKVRRGHRYPIKGTPCEQVLGRQFRAYPSKLCELFATDEDAQLFGAESYAGLPLSDAQGRPLGTIGIVSRHALANVERIESMLRIFAGRAAAEIERLSAREALQSSEASYRAIFEASEDAIFIHDWDSGAILDVNPKACEVHGCSHDELCRRSPAEIGLAEAGAAAGESLTHMQLAKLGRCPPFERQRRTRDGSLRRDEVRLKPAMIDGRHHIVAFTRDITERQAAVEALRAREEQYRVIFDGSADALAVWNDALRIVDVNPAFTRMFAVARELVIGRSIPRQIDEHERARRMECMREALAGREGEIETRAVRRDGSLFDIELRYLPIRYGGVPHVLAVGRDITERKAALAALQAQEQQYRGIFNASADALVLRAADFSIVDANATYERMSGFRREEVLGVDRVLANPPETMATIRALHERALAGEPVRLETELLRRDGERYDLELRGVPILHRGEPHVLYIGRDMTQSKRAERALRDSEEQYRAIFNASADGLVLRDADYRVVDVNPAYLEMSGYTRDEVLSATRVLTQADPDLQRLHREQHAEILAGQHLRFDVTGTRKDGAQFHAEVSGMPVGYRGRPHVLYAARDITERKVAADALRMREQQYRAIFDGSADAMVLWNSDVRFVDVNRAYTQMYGFARDEVIGAGLDDRLPADTAAERTACMRLALAGKECVLETTTLRKNGESFDVELRYLPIMHLGEPHVLAIARNITERRAAEAERERLEAQLGQAQKMEAIGQLTGGIAHDFNNILTSVIGYLVLGLERADTLGDASLQRQLGQAHLAAQRARDLIAQMLAFARRQRGERRILAPTPLVGQALQLLRATLPSSVSLDFAASPLVGGDELRVAADPVQLEQVLFNLCINARDAISGPGRIRVRLGGRSGGGWACASCRTRVQDGRWVELSVADSGSGIAPDLIERIFEPFTSSKEAGRGSGMGLAMVHGIVHDHGGHVLVETAAGAGSVFRVLLPPASGPAVDAPGAPAMAANAESLRGCVMVVDDEAMVGEFMAELLSGWGVEVVLQRSPLQALAWLEDTNEPLDLLITDQTMPQLEGLQLARQATALRPGLPVLLYTGNAETIDDAEARRHGVCGVLRKPVDTEQLRTAMRSCLDSVRAVARSNP